MPPLTRHLRHWWRTRPEEARNIWLGIAAFASAILVAIAATTVYLAPPSRQSVALEITDAAAIRIGDDVRVAGVSVGKVSDVQLLRDRVRVELSVDDEIFLGAGTVASVRMLTAAGGYYVALETAGEMPLGDEVIPAERAHAPYELADLLRDAPDKIEALNAPDIGTSLDQIATGLDANPGSIRSITDAVQALATVVDTQRQQIESTLSVSREYLSAFDDDREILFDMVRKAAIVLRVLEDTHVGFGQAYQGLADAFGRVAVLTDFYNSHSDEVAQAAQQLEGAAATIGTDVPSLIGQLTQFINFLQTLLGPDGVRAVAGDQVLATDLCVPIPGRSC